MNESELSEGIRRLNVVLMHFAGLDQDVAEEFADVAIEWTTATLAYHVERGQLQELFFAYVDGIYVRLGDAEDRFSESERNQIAEQAYSAGRRTQVLLPGIVRASLATLCDLPKNHPFSMFATLLRGFRGDYLSHVWLPLLAPVVGGCFMLCDSLEGLASGTVSKEIGLQSLADMSAKLGKASRYVKDEILAGRLQVKDGKIIAKH